MADKIKPYKKEFDFSYTLGTSVTIEMLKARPETARRVYVHSSCRDPGSVRALCEKAGVPWEISDKAFGTVKSKENCFVLGVFQKRETVLSPKKPHVVLVNPSDMGNVGTIVRAMAGMNYQNLAVIEPAADFWHPKTVRAGMGGAFHVGFARFSSFEDYRALYPEHALFPFMTDGKTTPEDAPAAKVFSLVFGNEARGLEPRFAEVGSSVRIPFCGRVDSFNLSVAAAIGLYAFARKNDLL